MKFMHFMNSMSTRLFSECSLHHLVGTRFTQQVKVDFVVFPEFSESIIDSTAVDS